MKRPALHKIPAMLFILSMILFPHALKPQDTQPRIYPVYDLKAERIRLANDSIKVTWKMDINFKSEIVIGRSEKEITGTEDVLKSQLIGTFMTTQEGTIIDRNLQQGKKYYYIAITKEDLFRRDLKILKNVNYTADPVALYTEPGPVESLESDIYKEISVELEWDKVKGDKLKYNIYRSKSIISSRAELEVAERIATTDDDSFIDTNIPEFGTYFYAITITDQNGVEYYTPVLNKNYTSKGIYIKGRTLTTPLNVSAFTGQNNSIIIKWEKGNSLTGKVIAGYEIYRSEEMIDSLLKLKFSKIIEITDESTTIYTEKNPGPGKYFYAVFARYNDGTVDISFDTDLNYTKTPVLIISPYTITATDAEITGDKVTISWNYTGNTGDETVIIFRSKKQLENSNQLLPDSIIGKENIKAGRFETVQAEGQKFYYGVFTKDEKQATAFKSGINISSSPIETEKKDISQEKTPDKTIEKDTEEDRTAEIIEPDNEEKEIPEKEHPADKTLDRIIKKYFYGARYHEAVKELNVFISGTDNEYEKARARLYLARTYIELEEYGKSVKLLNLADVQKFFPEEARFWSDFAMARIR